MAKRLAVGIGAVAIALAISSCGEPAPDSGQVVDRHFNPAHYDDYYTSYCAAYNSSGGCSWTVHEHHHDYIGDSWSIKIRGTNKNNKVVESWIDVGDYTYRNCSVGSTYPECGAK